MTRLLKDLRNQVSSSGDIGGNSDGGVMIVHEVERRGEVLIEGTLPNVDGYAWRTETENGKYVYYIDINADLSDVDLAALQVNIGGNVINNVGMDRLTYADGTLHIKAGWSGQSYGYKIIGEESDIEGQPIVAYTAETTLDKTYKEIVDAGFAVLHIDNDGTYVHPLAFFNFYPRGGFIGFLDAGTYIASTENDYPVLADLGTPMGPGDFPGPGEDGDVSE